jgi:hypothetical protein
MSFTSLMISFKARKRDVENEDTKEEKWTRCYKLASIVSSFGESIYKDLALFVCIIFAILAYFETTLY